MLVLRLKSQRFSGIFLSVGTAFVDDLLVEHVGLREITGQLRILLLLQKID